MWLIALVGFVVLGRVAVSGGTPAASLWLARRVQDAPYLAGRACDFANWSAGSWRAAAVTVVVVAAALLRWALPEAAYFIATVLPRAAHT